MEEIMSRELVSIGTEDTLARAWELIRQRRIRHLPVVEGTALVGILSDRDLRDASPSVLELRSRDFLEGTPVRTIMRPEVITLHPLETIEEAARLLYEHRIGCLPVVSRGELVGIVTETDILRSLVRMLGADRPGSHLEVAVPDRPGMLAEIAGMIKNHQVNISSVLTTPGQQEREKLLVFRLEIMDLRKIIKDIESAGYQVRQPLSR
ncbi:MAG: CBS and ACT domain-containing protein [Firmicutes bacterium]|nr:CBS and ACT domain-containing protein [Bacillota bacterium]